MSVGNLHQLHCLATLTVSKMELSCDSGTLTANAAATLQGVAAVGEGAEGGLAFVRQVWPAPLVYQVDSLTTR